MIEETGRFQSGIADFLIQSSELFDCFDNLLRYSGEGPLQLMKFADPD